MEYYKNCSCLDDLRDVELQYGKDSEVMRIEIPSASTMMNTKTLFRSIKTVTPIRVVSKNKKGKVKAVNTFYTNSFCPFCGIKYADSKPEKL